MVVIEANNSTGRITVYILSNIHIYMVILFKQLYMYNQLGRSIHILYGWSLNVALYGHSCDIWKVGILQCLRASGSSKV